MRYIAILTGLGLIGFLGYKSFMQPGTTTGHQQQQAPATDLPPPPPPPAQEPPPQVLAPDALEKVRTATRDSDSQVRWEAIQFLVQAHDPQAEEIMYFMLHRDSEASIRRDVVGLVTEKGKGPKVLENLIQALHDTDTDVRLAALDGLGKIGDYSAAPAITESIRDTDERVRLAAIRTLKQLESTRSQQIETTKRDHDEKVRAWEEEVRKRQEQAAKQKKQQ